MSVNYIVKEHISIKEYQDDCIVSSIVDTLVDIGREMLYDRAVIDKLSLTVNGKSYLYNGREITHEFHEIIRVINGVADLELTLAYDGGCYDFPIYESVKEAIEFDPNSADHIFYSLYNKADCEPGGGIISALGKKNGVLYNGVVEPKRYEELQNGEWESADTVIAFEEEISDSFDLETIKLCASELSDMQADIQFNITDTTVLLYVNSIVLNSVEKVKQFIEICNKLNRATDGSCGFIAEFADISGDDARTMIIDINDNGEFFAKVAQTEAVK